MMPAGLPFESRPLLTTTAYDEYESILNRELNEKRTVTPTRVIKSRVRLTGFQMSRLKFFGADVGQEIRVRSTPLTSWHAIRPLRGAVECHFQGSQATVGELLLLAPGHEVDLTWHQSTQAVVFTLPPDILADYVKQYHNVDMPLIGPRGWHCGAECAGVGSMAQLHSLLSFEVNNNDGLLFSNTGAQQLRNLCCENLLQLMPILKEQPMAGPLPGVVKRALEYIHAHLEAPLDMAALLTACATSRRSLEQSFQRILQTSPARYHRLRRLEALRTLLQHHRPGDIQLADLAYRWGFSQPSHFTALYKQTFGELPSVTLGRSD
ncbi:AraC family transcriptional regulator [Zobellella endophytica]|uniref:AraC family transcriptional regulator n=1 Tax=Zobellella endophytica TaxID=2116700 RepID=A0A2P7R3E8_9GAMM|nr:AraC family transcriptional regulator [Zobellella endophytica]PSJ44716.1 AraC family transcriptional regulator [Zobellella endophytica]